ncbi:MAG TPA: sigma-70 family RNA polymerase sigma factor [Candidatus Acidoferrales bacterium]|jgi:RNA polymerase sigma-70 factor (ECF subfamily)|nr:sigma-70 family RNA polymerase sigma factor [Candidatus Acidoferrales bacterium]
MTAALDPSDDRALVERIAMGDETAFAAAYDRHSGLVFGSLVRFLGDRDAAAEVAQDAFMALWRRAPQFDATAGSLSGWLLGIARHRAIDRHRAEGRRVTARSVPLSSLLGDDRDEAGGAGAADFPDWRVSELDPGSSDPAHRDPAAAADRAWVQSVVRSLVAELPEVERSVVVMAYAGGLSQSEIADRLGAPIGTVKSRTRRAFARLRAGLSTVPDLVIDADAVLGAMPAHGWIAES